MFKASHLLYYRLIVAQHLDYKNLGATKHFKKVICTENSHTWSHTTKVVVLLFLTLGSGQFN